MDSSPLPSPSLKQATRHLLTPSSSRPASPSEHVASSLPPLVTADTLLALIRQHRDGTLGAEETGIYRAPSYIVRHVSRDEYRAFEDALRRDRKLGRYLRNEVRYDCDPIEGEGGVIRVAIRMAEYIHDNVLEEIKFKIYTWLRQDWRSSASEEAIQRVAKNITFGGTAKIRLAGANWTKSPDAQYGFRGGYVPFIIEVGYSQGEKDLVWLAHTYIEHGARTVLTIDLPYESPSKKSSSRSSSSALPTGTLRLYRRAADDNDASKTVCKLAAELAFRANEDGSEEQADGGPTVELTLADFVPWPDSDETRDLCPAGAHEHKLVLDPEFLSDALAEAQHENKCRQAKRGRDDEDHDQDGNSVKRQRETTADREAQEVLNESFSSADNDDPKDLSYRQRLEGPCSP
jgi:hypothetical protein